MVNTLKKQVSLGGIIKENLPFPFVCYPNHYGTFFVFYKTPTSQPFFCECSKSAIENYLKLEFKINKNSTSKSILLKLDSLVFPEGITKLSFPTTRNDSLKKNFKYKKQLCHRCNFVSPTMKYCAKMYGGTFEQNYGWYIKQAYYKFGINQQSYDYLQNICPPNLQKLIFNIRKVEEKYFSHNIALRELIIKQPHKRVEILNNNRDYKRNYRQAVRKLSTIMENHARKEFGFKKVGENWVTETQLYYLVKQIFPNHEIIFHHRPRWLKGLEIDVFIPSLNLGFEYQGQQHYHSIKLWGGDAALQKTKERDKQKKILCKKLSVKLIEIKYTEPISKEFIEYKLKKHNVPNPTGN
jgi:hypothetical protein